MKLYRQGDVLLVGVPPAMAKELEGRAAEEKDARENGRVILAHGEVTGHAHEVVPGKESGREKGTVEFVELRERHDSREAARILRVKGRAAELRHEEHGTIVLPRGTYRVVRQREYSPEAIRAVAD